jgi:hypothetical protein
VGRKARNRGLQHLCEDRARRDGSEFEVIDVVILTRCNRRTLLRYTTGEKDCPRLEEKVAAVFNLSVAQLRRQLGLPKRINQNRRSP